MQLYCIQNSKKISIGLLLNGVAIGVVFFLGGCAKGSGESSTGGRKNAATSKPTRPQTVTEQDNAKIRRNLKAGRSALSTDLVLLTAQGLEKDGGRKNLLEARKIYQNYLKNGALERRIRQETFFGIGRCEAGLGRLWQAFLAIEQSFPDNLEAEGLAQRVTLEYRLGKQVIKWRKKSFPGAVENGHKVTGWEAGARIFGAVTFNDPRSPEAPQAFLLYGDCLTELAKYTKAEREYRTILLHFPRTPQVVEARAALAKAIVLKPYPSGVPEEVTQEYRRLLRESELGDPQTVLLHERIKDARSAWQERVAGDLLEHARVFLQSGTNEQKKSGRFMLQDIVKKYGKTKAAATARIALGLDSRIDSAANVR